MLVKPGATDAYFTIRESVRESARGEPAVVPQEPPDNRDSTNRTNCPGHQAPFVGSSAKAQGVGTSRYESDSIGGGGGGLLK